MNFAQTCETFFALIDFLYYLYKVLENEFITSIEGYERVESEGV